MSGSHPLVDESRHIPNTMPDYGAFITQLGLNSSQQSLPDSTQNPDHTLSFKSSSSYTRLKQETRAWLLKNVELIQRMYPPESESAPISTRGKSERADSIYIGCGGNAYLHWRLAQFFRAEGDAEKVTHHRKCALTAINVALSMLPKNFKMGKDISFYLGSAGIYALSTVIFSASGHLSRTEDQLRKLLMFLSSSLSPVAPDEILYGRAGYLFCLLFVQKHVSKELCERMGLLAAARQVFDAIVASGKKNSGVQHPNTGALKYFFYDTEYQGAAHGTAGIIYILLQFPTWCQEPAVEPWITATVDSLLQTQFPSGNFPNVLDSNEDKLVHWCHGSPGTVYTLYHAHKVLGEDKSILRSLDQSLKNIWERGILRKGFGLCHGTAGSGYAFLMMYRYTGSEEHLYRAHKMAEAVRSEEVRKEVEVFRDHQRYCVGIPNYPFSLMEGLGGTLCFCCDLLHPDTAAFPGYEGDI